MWYSKAVVICILFTGHPVRRVFFMQKQCQKANYAVFHLSTIKLTYEESLAEYEKRRETKLGRLIANREMPILKKANEIMSKL